MRPVAAAQGGKWAEPRDIRKAMARGDGLDVGGQGATLRVWSGVGICVDARVRGSGQVWEVAERRSVLNVLSWRGPLRVKRGRPLVTRWILGGGRRGGRPRDSAYR